MKYILMCGGDYHTEQPKQLRQYGTGLTIVERTILQLRIEGVEDIAISSNDKRFEKFGVPVLHHENNFGNGGHWLEAFYPMDEPVCYIFGDVFFSPEAIKKIVNTETDSIEFFASAPPFHPEYSKLWAEPFAFKVIDTKLFRACIDEAIYKAEQGKFNREPIAWELWQVIKGTQLNKVNYTNYVAINDYTTDFDNDEEFEEFAKKKWGKIEESNFERKCRVSMAESCFLDQGITQC